MIALTAHILKQSPDSNPANSAAIDTTGANLLVAFLSDFFSAASDTIRDSKSNTWTPLMQQATSSLSRGQWFYCKNPVVGTGHTFQGGAAGSFPSIAVMAFSGCDTTSPFDQQNGAVQESGTSVSTGSVLPTQANELVIYGCGFSGNYVSTSDGTDVDHANLSGGTAFGIATAYTVQTTATSASSTFTNSGSTLAAAVATFKAAGGGGGGGIVSGLLLVGAGK